MPPKKKNKYGLARRDDTECIGSVMILLGSTNERTVKRLFNGLIHPIKARREAEMFFRKSGKVEVLDTFSDKLKVAKKLCANNRKGYGTYLEWLEKSNTVGMQDGLFINELAHIEKEISKGR